MIGLDSPGIPEDTVLSFPTFCPNVTNLSPLAEMIGLDSPGIPEDSVFSFPIFCPNVANLSPLVENYLAGLSRYT
jgi:hypothetical protein